MSLSCRGSAAASTRLSRFFVDRFAAGRPASGSQFGSPSSSLCSGLRVCCSLLGFLIFGLVLVQIHSLGVAVEKGSCPGAARVPAAGLEVERCSYQNVVTFLPALALRTWQRIRKSAPRSSHGDLEQGTGFVNAMLARVLAAEGHWLRFANLPFGSSVLCLARKPAVNAGRT